jgi:hypothetical protein
MRPRSLFRDLSPVSGSCPDLLMRYPRYKAGELSQRSRGVDGRGCCAWRTKVTHRYRPRALSALIVVLQACEGSTWLLQAMTSIGGDPEAGQGSSTAEAGAGLRVLDRPRDRCDWGSVLGGSTGGRARGAREHSQPGGSPPAAAAALDCKT